MKNTLNILFIALIIFISCSDSKQEEPPIPPPVGNKSIYYPKNVWNVKEGNNYDDKNSQFNRFRMKETENLAAFWEAGFGDDPETCPDTKFRFPLTDLLNESEKIYTFFRDDLKFAEKGNSLTDKYKMLLYFYYSEEGTVYGGGAEDKVGVMWITPNRVKESPYAALAHEMGHAFQYMVAADDGWGYSTNPNGSVGQTIWEMTSQYMLWQYYPNWITFENYHLQTFMDNTHKAFLHEDNRYSSPFVLEFWADKHGKDIVAQVWQKSETGEDAVMTYKRITGISQDEFNDEIFEAYRRFITWDIDRVREVSKNYINQHATQLIPVSDGWYRISESKCPQNYGYNAIALEVPEKETEITIEFKGIAGEAGFRSIKTDKAGWRYGFVAVKNNSERVYGDIHSDLESEVNFVVPENTSHLWLVVSGAPKDHWEHLWDENPDNDEQWPYQIKLTGTTVKK